jgi:hypothetical protein
MLRSLRVNYILADDTTWERLMLACDELGWTKKLIVKQAIHGFCRRDGDFYAQAGVQDARARGMTEQDYFKVLRDGSPDDLAPYLENSPPKFGVSPLMTVPLLPTGSEYKRPYNYIDLSAYNYVLVRVAHIVERGSLIQVISRMVVKHLEDNWTTAYQLQIDRDRECRFRL